MKSLNDKVIKNKKIFTPEIIEWIEEEGFEIKEDYYSYCTKLYQYEKQCYYKNVSDNSQYNINVYIFSYGIGIDIDLKNSINLSTNLWLFDIYSFEEAYDEMVEYVNNYKEK